MELDLREHDLRRVVEQTLDLAGAELKEHRMCAIEFDAPMPAVPVRVDAELMRQALLNLLLNAMQAMPAGGVVRVSVRRDQRLAIVSRLRITVRAFRRRCFRVSSTCTSRPSRREAESGWR